ncbi:CBS domain-containing protein [Candidatus Micrarchaeota archaeon]|nr:CBS domain-containing protein [Candidatus Micrarchaeota archaeon]
METGIKVGDIMKTRLVSITENSTIQQAAKIMKSKDVGSVLVTDKSKHIYGILTDRDLVEKALAKGLRLNTSIKGMVSKPLIGIDPSEDLTEAARLMGNEDLRRLVVFKEGKVVGILSEKDIVKISPSLYDIIAEKVEGHLK